MTLEQAFDNAEKALADLQMVIGVQPIHEGVCHMAKGSVVNATDIITDLRSNLGTAVMATQD